MVCPNFCRCKIFAWCGIASVVCFHLSWYIHELNLLQSGQAIGLKNLNKGLVLLWFVMSGFKLWTSGNHSVLARFQLQNSQFDLDGPTWHCFPTPISQPLHPHPDLCVPSLPALGPALGHPLHPQNLQDNGLFVCQKELTHQFLG